MLHKETVEAKTLDLIYRLMVDENLKSFTSLAEPPCR